MTIQSETAKAVYVADGIGKNFSIPFYFLDNEIAVYVSSTKEPLTLGVDYSVSGSGNYQGGEITFMTAPDEGTVITILRNVSLTQLVKFLEGENFPASDFECSLDKIIMALQQVKEHLNNFVKVPYSSSLTADDFQNLLLELNNNLETINRLPQILQRILTAEANIGNQLTEYSSTDEIKAMLADYYTKDDVDTRLSLITGYRFHNLTLLLNNIEEDENNTYAEYPYKGTLYLDMAKSSQIPLVTFGLNDALSGNFAPIADTAEGTVQVYMKEMPEQNVIISSLLLY